jgi:hypothetical protein
MLFRLPHHHLLIPKFLTVDIHEIGITFSFDEIANSIIRFLHWVLPLVHKLMVNNVLLQ